MMRMMYRLLVLFSLSLLAIKGDSGQCEDGGLCDYWAGSHRCISSPESMTDTCPVMCENPCICNLTGINDDVACDCVAKAKDGYCDTDDAILDCNTTCSRVKTVSCPTLGAPSDLNAMLTSTSTSYLSDVLEVCREGYNPTNSLHMGRAICTLSGFWHRVDIVGEPVTCQVVDCGSPPLKVNTTLLMTGTTYKSNTTYSCRSGYKYVSGDTYLTCEANGEWSGELLTCHGVELELDSEEAVYEAVRDLLTDLNQRVVECGQPPTAEGAIVGNVSGTKYLDTAQYACAEGWEYVSGHTTLTCETHGSWDGSLIVCSRIECGDVVVLDYSVASHTTTNFESVVIYSCILGHEMVGGDKERVCLANGTWTGDPLVCLPVVCSAAPVYAGARQWTLDGRSFDDVTPYLYQARVFYECYYQEFEGQGKQQWILTCGPYKTWEGTSPLCGADSEFKRDEFDPDPFEAPGSWALGLIIFSVLIFFIVVFIIMDVETMKKHFKYMKSNLRNFRRVLKKQWKKLRTRRQVQTTSLSDIQVKEQPASDDSADGAPPRKRALQVIRNLTIVDDESVFESESEPSTPKTMTSFV